MKPISSKRLKTFLLFFLLANVSALLNTFVIITLLLAEGDKINYIKYFIYEFTGSYSFFFLIPAMIFLIRKFPITISNFFPRIPIYILTIACLGAVHTALMYYSRIMIFDFAGWGNYNYGDIPYRYIMETLKLFTGFLLVYFVYSFVVSNKEKQEEKLKTIKLEEQLSRTRLEILKNQIHPHFLFNTLNMISSTMYDDIQSADKMIADLSDLLRISLSNSNEGKILLTREIETLRLYLDIMKGRFKDKLDVEFSIDEETKNASVPSFIFQPIAENSIKFGMETLSLLKIMISSKKIDGNLILTISDNGPGIKNLSEIDVKKGVGISNTIERLEKLYGNSFKFGFDNNKPNGLIVTITIPFENESNG